jgi:outer membrane usher protein
MSGRALSDVMPIRIKPSCQKSALFTVMPLIVAIGAAINGAVARADAVKFDSSFMQPFGGVSAGPNLDLDAIAQNGTVGPGIYPVTIRLNQSFFERRDIEFVADGQQQVKACLTVGLLEDMGVKLDAFIKPGEALPKCVDLERLVEGAMVSFDSGHLALDISVPQIALRRDAVGYVSPQEWDSGINAALLNYQFSGGQGHTDSQGSNSQYNLYLNAGLNIAGWRLRSSSSLSQTDYAGRDYQRTNTFAQRDLPGATGTLTLGESFTQGDVFDSLPFRGVQVASDLGMLPDSMQGYAPVIRGIAETQAKVEVRQNGFSLYSTYVPPGPFEIDDLTAAAGSGELEVIITEADGRERRFTQPYATLGNMLRENTWRYSLTAGEYNALEGDRPKFGQATLAYGLPYDFTLYGGLLGSNFYQAAQFGLGKSLGSIGAISMDMTEAATDIPQGGRDKGQSYGMRYGKAFATGTSVRFAGYRYSTEGYRDFGEAAWQQQESAYQRISKRSKLEASVAQAMDYGSFYLTLGQQNYWGSSRREQQMQLGFNTQYRHVNFGIYASKSLSDSFGETNQIALTVSVPLGGGSSANYGLTRNNDGNYDQRAGFNGRAGRNGDLNYNIDANHSAQSGNAGSVSIGYRAPFAQLGAGLSVGSDYEQATLNASGSLLGHSGGLEFGHTLGETIGLVHVPDTPNVGVLNAPGTVTNARGYSLVPYLTPYRRNRLTLDTHDLDPNIDIENGVTNVVPRRGAVVKASFKATHSIKAVVNLRLPDGGLPPFGSQVLDSLGSPVGMVGPGGQVLMSIGEQPQYFTVKWGKGADEQCQSLVGVEAGTVTEGYPSLELICEPQRDALRMNLIGKQTQTKAVEG